MEASQTKTFDDVKEAFQNGSVLKANRRELEQFLLAIGTAYISHPANQTRASEMGETIRLLLMAKVSQELHDKATRIAIIALVISIVALLISVAQLVVAAR